MRCRNQIKSGMVAKPRVTEDKASFHLRGNHRITFEADGTATMVSHGYAWNQMERGALPENGGNAI